MKIVYLHQYFKTPDMAGGTRSFEMAKRWANLGHEVHIVTSARDTNRVRHLWRTTEIEGMHVHWCNVSYGNGMGFARRLRAFVSFAILAGPRARRLRGDVIFATSTPLTIIFPAIYAKFARRTAIVFEVRDLWPDMPIAVGALKSSLAKRLARLLEWVAYSQSARIVALSDGMARGVERRGVDSNKIIVAPNSCDFDHFSVPRETGLKYRAQHSWLGDRDFVVYCGTLGEVNGVTYLVRLAEEMMRRGHPVVFGVYGSGKDEATVRWLASELNVLDRNFFMMGEISKEEVPEILSAASICSSLFVPIEAMEVNSANKFFDALAASRPVAINYGGWQADLIRNERIGLTLDPHDFERAASMLIDFLEQPVGDIRRVGESAGRVGREHFAREMISLRVLGAILAAHATSQPQATDPVTERV